MGKAGMRAVISLHEVIADDNDQRVRVWPYTTTTSATVGGARPSRPVH
jgi:hypothetical protein